ncbi:MAG: hypothetical protein KME09_00920 [Pleurocapsa minor HA4230-MV1]|jgi:hypothetical protein|nr:hypothetical protein [Pleurocapsa minor HA4230-MV1]
MFGNIGERLKNDFWRYFLILPSHIIEIPNQDPSKPWIIVKSFERQAMAITFAKRVWGAEKGFLCLISEEAAGYVVKVPRLSYSPNNNQFIIIEKFERQIEALKFVQEKYRANQDGYISLISEIV